MVADKMNPRDNHGAPSPYRGLIYKVFQPRRDSGQGVAIAVTSPHSGAGTTYVACSLAAELGSYPGTRILNVDLAALAGNLRADQPIMELVTATSGETIYEIKFPLSANGTAPSSWWHASMDHRRQSIDRLRAGFQYVIFDCPAILEGSEALGIAELVDGILLVVEADRTLREDVAAAESQIESAGGRIYGTVLNKVQPGMPEWALRKG